MGLTLWKPLWKPDERMEMMKNVTAPMVKIEDKLMLVRNQYVLLDRDVAALYGVETRAVNQAVKNNPNKFPRDYIFQLDGVEFESLKSKILISNNPNGRGGVRKLPMAFTEKGLYMLATILKSKVAAEATIEIIETFALVRQLKRDVLVLHSEKDKLKQKSVIKRFGEALVDIVMPNEASTETESSIELNFVVAKLKHTVRKIRRANG